MSSKTWDPAEVAAAFRDFPSNTFDPDDGS
jgi:hypothetical protein